MVVTYYVKLLRTGADRHNGILIFLLLLVAKTINRPEVMVYRYKIFRTNINECCLVKKEN